VVRGLWSLGLQFVQRRESGGHGERIAAEGAGLIDGTEWRQAVHDVGAPAERAYGQAAPDDLAEGREVGGDPEPALRAIQPQAKAGHHFVGDQDGAVVAGELAQPFE